MDLALNNLQRLICHKTKQTKPNQTLPEYADECNFFSPIFLYIRSVDFFMGQRVTRFKFGAHNYFSHETSLCVSKNVYKANKISYDSLINIFENMF